MYDITDLTTIMKGSLDGEPAQPDTTEGQIRKDFRIMEEHVPH